MYVCVYVCIYACMYIISKSVNMPHILTASSLYHKIQQHSFLVYQIDSLYRSMWKNRVSEYVSKQSPCLVVVSQGCQQF